MRLIDKRPKLSRRTVLAVAGATVAVAGTDPKGVVTGKAWAAAPQALSPDTFATLVLVARDTYPHDKIADKYYAVVIEGLDTSAKDDAALKDMLETGVADLNQKAVANKYGSYSSMTDENERVELLKSIETTPFFQKIRGNLITGIYNNQELWPFFGYEGESASKGGYLHRGFNDIDWL